MRLCLGQAQEAECWGAPVRRPQGALRERLNKPRQLAETTNSTNAGAHRVGDGGHLLPHAHELGQQVESVIHGQRACGRDGGQSRESTLDSTRQLLACALGWPNAAAPGVPRQPPRRTVDVEAHGLRALPQLHHPLRRLAVVGAIAQRVPRRGRHRLLQNEGGWGAAGSHQPRLLPKRCATPSKQHPLLLPESQEARSSSSLHAASREGIACRTLAAAVGAGGGDAVRTSGLVSPRDRGLRLLSFSMTRREERCAPAALAGRWAGQPPALPFWHRGWTIGDVGDGVWMPVACAVHA